MGQDIAEYGGVFKVTKGFVEEFGKARVRNTPIIESGAIGAGLGLALDGFRPMVEMQYRRLRQLRLQPDRQQPGQDALPLGRGGAGGGAPADRRRHCTPGRIHSQNVEAWFTSVAGLKVVAPATPSDAKGLLIAACEDGNPVLFLEHKWLVSLAEGTRAGRLLHDADRPRAPRARRDATRRSSPTASAVHWALEAAERARRRGPRRSR